MSSIFEEQNRIEGLSAEDESLKDLLIKIENDPSEDLLDDLARKLLPMVKEEIGKGGRKDFYFKVTKVFGKFNNNSVFPSIKMSLWDELAERILKLLGDKKVDKDNHKKDEPRPGDISSKSSDQPPIKSKYPYGHKIGPDGGKITHEQLNDRQRSGGIDINEL